MLTADYPTYYNLTGIILCYIPKEFSDEIITDNLPMSLLGKDPKNEPLSHSVLLEKIKQFQKGWNIFACEKENSIIVWSVEDLFVTEDNGDLTFVLEHSNNATVVIRWRESNQSWRILLCKEDTLESCKGIANLLNCIFPYCSGQIDSVNREAMEKVRDIENLKEEQRARISNLISSIQKIHEHFSNNFGTLPAFSSLEEISDIGNDKFEISNYVSRFILSFYCFS